MKPFAIRFTREAEKDAALLTPKLRGKLRDILVHTLAVEPRVGKRLAGDLEGFYSYRLTYKDRIVYSIEEPSRTIFVHRCRTHYGE